MVNLINQHTMTDACSIPRASLSSTVVGMAHFAGTGPVGTNCGGCAFWAIPDGKKKPICEKYAQLTGSAGKTIPSTCASCRYYSPRSRA